MTTLAAAPIEFFGDWGESSSEEARLVIARLRNACLTGVDLPSDRQPERLKVEARVSAVPHVWLDETRPTTASVVVDGSGRNWPRMAYQLGHELGHVVCNSWQVDGVPLKPSQWLEECLAEAFSLRGLARLADSWEKDPVLADQPDYAKHFRRYRELTIAPYRRAGPPFQLHSWFSAERIALENGIGGRPATGPAMLMILAELDRDPGCVADLGAVNRWPSRAAAPLEDYLRLWQESCAELGAAGHLPLRIRDLLFFDEPAPLTYRRPQQPNLRQPRRGEVRQQVVAVDDLVPLDHPVRAVWAFAAGLDLSGVTGGPGGPARPAPALLVALWLWATIEGIGSARHLAHLCDYTLAYRWLCGGVAIDHETLIAFREKPNGAVDRLLAHGVAALVEAAVVAVDLLSPAEVKAKGLAGASAARRRRRLKALAAAAEARVRQLRAEIDKDDPIADERQRQAAAHRTAQAVKGGAAAALARLRELAIPKKPDL